MEKFGIQRKIYHVENGKKWNENGKVWQRTENNISEMERNILKTKNPQKQNATRHYRWRDVSYKKHGVQTRSDPTLKS